VTFLSAALAFAAVLLWWAPWPIVRVRTTGFRLTRAKSAWSRTAVGLVVVGSVLILPGPPTILVWTAVAVCFVLWRRHRRAKQRVRAAAVAEECHRMLDVLVSELSSGTPAQVAAKRVAAENPALAPVATAAAAGGDIGSAFIAVSKTAGAHTLAQVGAGWAVSDVTGAPLGEVLARVRDSGREDVEIDREVAAAVAPARATATLMAAMPPLGLSLGSGLGVDPLATITGSIAGAGCVALGTCFALVGITWIDRVADRLELAS